MKTSTRRGFLNAAATAISGVVAGGAAPPSLANAAPYDADAIAAEIDPGQIEPALRTGYGRAKVEADKIQKFWA